MKQPLKRIVSAMFIAMGIILPFLTAQIKEIGDTLLPMHIPVLLSGLVCGAEYGAVVGFTTPLLRSAMFGMPPMYPTAVSMAFELCTYGLVVGLLYARKSKKSLFHLYSSLIFAMLAGRMVWGVVNGLLLGGNNFTFKLFLAGGFIDAFPGIILQLVLIPVIMQLVEKRRKV